MISHKLLPHDFFDTLKIPTALLELLLFRFGHVAIFEDGPLSCQHAAVLRLRGGGQASGDCADRADDKGIALDHRQIDWPSSEVG